MSDREVTVTGRQIYIDVEMMNHLHLVVTGEDQCSGLGRRLEMRDTGAGAFAVLEEFRVTAEILKVGLGSGMLTKESFPRRVEVHDANDFKTILRCHVKQLR
jgi:hypothetical protein